VILRKCWGPWKNLDNCGVALRSEHFVRTFGWYGFRNASKPYWRNYFFSPFSIQLDFYWLYWSLLNSVTKSHNLKYISHPPSPPKSSWVTKNVSPQLSSTGQVLKSTWSDFITLNVFVCIQSNSQNRSEWMQSAVLVTSCATRWEIIQEQRVQNWS